ncbi:unnamed protein product [Pelagomonas calceolata]|uniref:Dolichol kinase n=1 Tax=Pelagomonas calceolata TaxID=35677 RepID=A0A8J2T0Y5_9STRA|nr:unnamed protein product [Pelagomonas calceolata]
MIPSFAIFVLLNINASVALLASRPRAHLVPHNHRLQPRHPFALPATQQDDADAAVSPDITSAVALFAAVPAGALVLQLLYAQRVLLPLLLVKRVYIYAMATYVVAVGGARGGGDPSALGTRLESLTREVLPDSLAPTTDLAPLQKLDAVDETQQAALVPAAVAASLLLSLGLLALASSDGGAVREAAASATSLAALSTAGTLGIFTRAELQRVGAPAATALAAVLVAFAYLVPAAYAWPVQNILCMCLAIATARALQFSNFAALCAAAAALVAYDVASVAATLPLATAAVGAKAAAGAGATAGAPSAAAAASPMGAVAVSRLSEGFQPGLLQVRLGGRVSDVLGLGDSVFPALVAGFAKRYDLAQEESRLFPAALAGFGVGCLLCELSPGIDGRGLPALLYILPVMLLAVLATATVNGDDVFEL